MRKGPRSTPLLVVSRYCAFDYWSEHYEKPFIFSEFGCIGGDFQNWCPFTYGGRTFDQVRFTKSTAASNECEDSACRLLLTKPYLCTHQITAMMTDMSDMTSGGAVFEYSMHANQYGLVLNPGFTRSSTNEVGGSQMVARSRAGGARFMSRALAVWLCLFVFVRARVRNRSRLRYGGPMRPSGSRTTTPSTPPRTCPATRTHSGAGRTRRAAPGGPP